MKRTNIKFNHEANTIHGALGIPEAKMKEIVDMMNEKEQTGAISVFLEECFKEAKNINECIYMAIQIGTAVGRQRENPLQDLMDMLT